MITVVLNCNNISHYYCLYCILIKLSSLLQALVRRDFLKKILQTQNFWTAAFFFQATFFFVTTRAVYLLITVSLFFCNNNNIFLWDALICVCWFHAGHINNVWPKSVCNHVAMTISHNCKSAITLACFCFLVAMAAGFILPTETTTTLTCGTNWGLHGNSHHP